MRVWLLNILVICELLDRSDGYQLNSTNGFNRKIRVTWGSPLRERNVGYDSVLYYVWLGMGNACGHDYVEILKFPFRGYCNKGTENTRCSGSLITWNIVLTAAHCLAVDKQTSGEDLWMSFTVKSAWENLLEAVIGYNTMDEFPVYGMKARKFLVHQKYAILKSNSMATHDFGWVVLDNAFPEPSSAGLQPYRLAPLYPIATHTLVYEMAHMNQCSCLVIGFGRYGPDTRSDVLRHGWVMLDDYFDTYYMIRVSYFRRTYSFPFDYRERATWSNMREFGRHREAIGLGDSGGPVTCNNYHFAVASSTITFRGNVKWKPYIVTVTADVAFIIYETSGEYRKAFVDAIDKYSEITDPPTFAPPFTTTRHL